MGGFQQFPPSYGGGSPEDDYSGYNPVDPSQLPPPPQVQPQPNYLGLPWRKPRIPGVPQLAGNPMVSDGPQGLTGRGPLMPQGQQGMPQPAQLASAGPNIQPSPGVVPPQPRLTPQAQPQQMQSPPPAQMDPLTAKLSGLAAQSLPNVAPQPPKPPGKARAIIGGILGATKFASLAPLVEYGPTGLAQAQKYAQYQQQLPEAQRIAGLSSQERDRMLRGGELQEAQKTREQTAYDNEVKTITSTMGGELHNPEDTLAPNWNRRTITNPATGKSETYHIPSTSELARLKKQAQIDAEQAGWVNVSPDLKKQYPDLPDRLPAKDLIDAWKEIHKAPPASQTPLNNVQQLNQALTRRVQHLNAVTGGDPKAPLPQEYTLPPTATKEDFDRIDKILEAEERTTQTSATAKQMEADRAQSRELVRQGLQLRVHTEASKPYLKYVSDADSQISKVNDTLQLLNDANISADALAIPKVMTALVSGQGTGVRINEAELNRIGKARGVAGDVQAFFSKATGKGSLTPEQRQQYGQILNDVKNRILQKQAIANNAVNKIDGSMSMEDANKAAKEARDAISAFEAAEPVAVGAPGKNPFR